MKFLKKINESFNESANEDEVKDFCSDNLAYLTDDDFSLSVYKYGDGVIEIMLNKNEGNFGWLDIKDDFIPFIELLKSKYNITNTEGYKSSSSLFSPIKFFGDRHSDTREYLVREVLNDDVRDELKFKSIVFYVK